jgi:hypothetical protein
MSGAFRPRLVELVAALSLAADLGLPWFSGHSGRVAETAAATATELGLPRFEVVRLRRAACVHALRRSGGISAKTTDHHIQHIYAKIGASNRSVATLFAMQHGLLGT